MKNSTEHPVWRRGSKCTNGTCVEVAKVHGAAAHDDVRCQAEADAEVDGHVHEPRVLGLRGSGLRVRERLHLRGIEHAERRVADDDRLWLGL